MSYKKKIFITILTICFIMSVYPEPPSRILIGASSHKVNVVSDCDQIEILTNYKHIKITIANLTNIDKVLITDKIITNCNSKECAVDSNICQSTELSNNKFLIILIRQVNRI
jgi:hypothetical protein